MILARFLIIILLPRVVLGVPADFLRRRATAFRVRCRVSAFGWHLLLIVAVVCEMKRVMRWLRGGRIKNASLGERYVTRSRAYQRAFGVQTGQCWCCGFKVVSSMYNYRSGL